MSERICPVKDCGRSLGTTKNGNPWLMCRFHYARLHPTNQLKLWRAYGSWQRLERTYLAILPAMRPRALLEARALAINAYIDVRNDCLRQAADKQLEVVS